MGSDARKLAFGNYNPEPDDYVDTWLTAVANSTRADEILVGAQWPQEALYYVVGSRLEGSAATFFNSLEQIATPGDRRLDRLAERLHQQHGTKMTEATVVNKMMQRKKDLTESYQEYAMALRDLAQGVSVGERVFIEAFEDGLGDFTGSLVRNKSPAMLMDAVHHATMA
jgi:hypothetical protein